MTNQPFPVGLTHRRYLRQVAITMALYVLTIFFSVKAQEHYELQQWVRILVALLPVVPLLLYFGALIQFYVSVDEMSKQIQAQAAGIAGLLTGLICVVVGLLERAGVPQMNGLWIFAILFICFGLSEQLLRRRYR